MSSYQANFPLVLCFFIVIVCLLHSIMISSCSSLSFGISHYLLRRFPFTSIVGLLITENFCSSSLLSLSCSLTPFLSPSLSLYSFTFLLSFVMSPSSPACRAHHGRSKDRRAAWTLLPNPKREQVPLHRICCGSRTRQTQRYQCAIRGRSDPYR